MRKFSSADRIAADTWRHTDKEDIVPNYPFLTEALHADWPAYPTGHGVDHALDTLCNLPPGTRFTAIDDIDQSLLMVAMDHLEPDEANEYHPDHHHVALWHEDLRLLRDMGLAEGFSEPTADELRDEWADFAMGQPKDRRAAAWLNAMECDWKGLLRKEAEKDEITTGSISRSGIAVSPAGWKRHHERLSALEVHPDLEPRALVLADLGYHDVAAREAGAALVDSLRRRTGADLSGQPLVDAYVERIVESAGINGAFQRHVRNELRALLLCLRREAGGAVDLALARCHALLRRTGMVLKMLDHADEGPTCYQDIMLVPRPEEPAVDNSEIPF